MAIAKKTIEQLEAERPDWDNKIIDVLTTSPTRKDATKRLIDMMDTEVIPIELGRFAEALIFIAATTWDFAVMDQKKFNRALGLDDPKRTGRPFKGPDAL